MNFITDSYNSVPERTHRSERGRLLRIAAYTGALVFTGSVGDGVAAASDDRAAGATHWTSTRGYEKVSVTEFPGDGEWRPLPQGGSDIADVDNDGQDGAREIVGEPGSPAVYTYVSDTHLFVRMRLDGDPRPNNRWAQFGWGLLVNTDGDFSSYEYSLILKASGGQDELIYAYNSTPEFTGDPNDRAECVLKREPVVTDAPDGEINTRVLPADSSIGGDADFFLDYAVPLAWTELVDGELGNGNSCAAPKLDLSRPVEILAGTSSSGQSLSLDLAGCDNSGNIEACHSDPVDLLCGNGVVDGDEQCDGGDDCQNDCTPTPVPAVCGDGVLQAGEGCDDGNRLDDGNGCSADCVIELGFPCNGDPAGATGDESCASGLCDSAADGPGVCSIDTDRDGIADSSDIDDDNDGIPDVTEGTGDTDGDGVIDALDLDADGDGLNDVDEAGHAGVDSDGDGRLDCIDAGVGSNGLCDDVETAPDSGITDYDGDGEGPDAPVDLDADGLPDFQDTVVQLWGVNGGGCNASGGPTNGAPLFLLALLGMGLMFRRRCGRWSVPR